MSEYMKRPEHHPESPTPEPRPPHDRAMAEQPTVQHIGDSVTTGTIPFADPDPVPRRTRPVKPWPWLGVLAAAWLVLGVLAGVLWHAIVPLSNYEVNQEGFAATGERGLAGYIAGDAWFVIIGVVLGMVCGLVSWRWFAGVGWPVVSLALGGSLLMGVLCWLVGWTLGPGPFEPRLAAAHPGDVLPIELTVRGPAALFAWPFGASLVVMLLSALTRDPEEPN